LRPDVLKLERKADAPAIRDSGYEPMRIDRKEHINKIDDEIIAEIRRSCFWWLMLRQNLIGREVE
jgi:hypothetical protein